MSFDLEGHALVSPEHIPALLCDRLWLINGLLLNCVPVIFAQRRRYQEFLESLSACLKVHSKNFAVRGSTLLGFSLRPDKLWVSYGPESDVDLAIIDADYYHVLDREVRHLEARPVESAGVRGESVERRRRRKGHRKFYCYRYFDLPDLGIVQDQKAALKPAAELLDSPRTIQAFVFRDWWALFDKWDHELITLATGLEDKRFQAPPAFPRPIEEGISLTDS